MIILPNGVATHDYDLINDWMAERGLCYDMMVRPSIIPLLKQGDWVVDGGAAVGDHTVAYLEAVGPTGKVFAFEPGSEAFKCLQHNCPNAVAINKMLWHQRTSLYLCLTDTNMGGSYASHVPPESGIRYEGPIYTVVLDDMNLERLDLLKLDLEGSELYALLGAEKTITKFRPKIILEMNSSMAERSGYTKQDIYDLLRKWNYMHYSISGGTEPECGDCDIAAIPL